MLRITFFRGRHEKQSHPDLQATYTSSPETGHVINSAEEKKEDHVFNYHKAKLTYGLLLSDFGDAIREGDGQRLLSLYKFFPPLSSSPLGQFALSSPAELRRD